MSSVNGEHSVFDARQSIPLSIIYSGRFLGRLLSVIFPAAHTLPRVIVGSTPTGSMLDSACGIVISSAAVFVLLPHICLCSLMIKPKLCNLDFGV